MTDHPDIEAERAAVLARLRAFRAARAALPWDILEAHELGLTQAEIAVASGFTRQGIARNLRTTRRAL